MGREPEEAKLTYLLNGASNDMTVDGSVTPVDFSYTVPAGKRFDFQRMMLYVEDGTAFDSTDFGDIVGPLANGVELIVAGNTIATWKDNIDIVTTMYDFVGYPNFGKETQVGAGRWTMGKSFGDDLIVRGGESITFRINDNLGALVIFRATVHGRLWSS